MSILETLIFSLAVELYAGAISWRFYKSAGYPAWAAFVPVYNTYILTKIIQRPAWWVILFYIPVVGNIMGIVAVYELFHVFKFEKLKHTYYTLLTAGLYMASINYGKQKLEHADRNIENIRKYVSELASSLIFAIVAATIIRAFTFEAFTIPTPSMEKSMMVGDFLFVSKAQYGSRLPMTPIAVPLVHNRVPGINIPSYLDWVQLPYVRLPKIGDVQRLDPVVFNYPMEDEKPIDKREHYVKRCLAVPGDELEIKDGQVYINGEMQELPDRALPQFSYYVRTKQDIPLNPKVLKEQFDINYVPRKLWADERQPEGDVTEFWASRTQLICYIATIPEHKLEEFKTLPNVEEVIRLNAEQDPNDYPAEMSKIVRNLNLNHSPGNHIFPNPAHGQVVFKWTRDNYGPLHVPEAGETVELTRENFLKFRRIIEVYEGNTLEVRGDNYFINGEQTTTYTFKQGYYWMMGDNRHNSLDSRYWGYVPADHIVGKPVFIWMSYDKFASGLKKIRTDRVFTTVNGSGKRVSYFWPFVAVVVAFSIFNRIRKKRKAQKDAA